ncbi:rRNA-binding ribosome biosynthesis protein utp25 [Serendipita sp. 398]|nr:rRNA-binding ribosome biosynthesis protein utp25 [Serendipita sp. 398]
MSGNIDDYFRIGMKVTRKSVKLFSDFYSSDIIVASPLGLRELIEKERPSRSADYLSSIEILIIDQLDVLAMQNWNHLKLIFEHINKIPKQSHDTDFSRVKPWYLDGHAAYLRQSILLSAYETPEIRSLFNKNLLNVSGKQRIQSAWAAAQVPEGIRQASAHFAQLHY